jgi:hypothetical protein
MCVAEVEASAPITREELAAGFAERRRMEEKHSYAWQVTRAVESSS